MNTPIDTTTLGGGFAIHPAANLFPAMNDAEFEEFKEDIRQNGQQVPILVQNGHPPYGRRRVPVQEAVQQNDEYHRQAGGHHLQQARQDGFWRRRRPITVSMWPSFIPSP